MDKVVDKVMAAMDGLTWQEQQTVLDMACHQVNIRSSNPHLFAKPAPDPAPRSDPYRLPEEV